MYALFGFLGILLLLAGLLPVRVLPGFLRGRPRKERRAMWVSGLIIVLIAGAFTPSDDESRQEVASNESKAAAAGGPCGDDVTIATASRRWHARDDEPTNCQPRPDCTS